MTPPINPTEQAARLEHTGILDLLEGSLGGGAFLGLENTEVVQPCTAVEFGVDGLDQEWVLRAALWVWRRFDEDDAGDLFLRCHARRGAWAGRAVPSKRDGIAVVPDIKNSKRNWCLTALARDERAPGGEGWPAKRSWSVGASVVDELIDGVGVVLEVRGEGLIDETGGEGVGDRGSEVGGDLIGL